MDVRVKNRPLFSIIIPMYNVSAHIASCIVSIMNQTNDDYECIIINDGSTDGCDKIVEGLIKNRLRFHLLSQKNSGVGVARNLGIKNAMGEYIWFVDGDDRVNVHALEVLSNIIKENKYPDIVKFGFVRGGVDILSKFEKSIVDSSVVQSYDLGNEQESIAVFSQTCGSVLAWNNVVRADVASKLRFKEIPNGEDVLWGVDIILGALRYISTPVALYGYFENSLGASKKHDERYLHSIMRTCDFMSRSVFFSERWKWYREKLFRKIAVFMCVDAVEVLHKLPRVNYRYWFMQMREIFLGYKLAVGPIGWWYRLWLHIPSPIVANLMFYCPLKALIALRGFIRR